MISGPQSSYSPLTTKATAATAVTPSAPVLIPANPVTQQPPSVQQNVASQQPVSAMTLGGIWQSIKTTVGKIWTAAVDWIGKLFGKKETVDPQVQQIAAQYKLFPTKENVDAFLAEVNAYETDGTIGPGSPDSASVKELQGALKQLGYTVDDSGVYDAKTSEAVMKFKRDNNIHQNYKNADGTWAVNEYTDPTALKALATRLQGGTPVTPTDPGKVETEAIAKQYNLLPTADNVQAFLAELQGYEKNGAMGPGAETKKDDVIELQQILKSLGHQVTETGTYDQATGQAVIAFKKANNLHQNYKGTDGTWAVNEYLDMATLEVMLQKVKTNTPAPAATGTVVDTAAIAKQYGLLSTKENVEAFLKEAGTYEGGGALGPGSTATADIQDLQQILKGWNYSVTVNGQYDQATSQAVVQFKQQNGLHQGYKLADGNWAINEYADSNTLKTILDKIV